MKWPALAPLLQRLPLLSPLSLALLGVGCGDPLADAAFLGDPLVAMRVEIAPEHEIPNDHLHLALFWAAPDAPLPGAQRETATGVDLPSRPVIRVFDLPDVPADAVGRIVLFRDLDGDGRYSASDRLHGVVPGALVRAPGCPVALGWRADCAAPCAIAPAQAALDPDQAFTWQPFCEARP